MAHLQSESDRTAIKSYSEKEIFIQSFTRYEYPSQADAPELFRLSTRFQNIDFRFKYVTYTCHFKTYPNIFTW